MFSKKMRRIVSLDKLPYLSFSKCDIETRIPSLLKEIEFMKLRLLERKDYNDWIGLAREVEPLFGPI